MSDTTAAPEAATKSDGWHRQGLGIRIELRDGLQRAVELAGAKNLSALVSALAMEPERAGALLAPLVADVKARQEETDPKKVSKKQRDMLLALVKEGKVKPDELAQALEAIRARRQQESPDVGTKPAPE